jgi:hypothetical protein
MWLIAKKELLTNMLTARFVTGFLLCLFVIPFTLLVNIQDYEARMSVYEVERDRAEESNKRKHVLWDRTVQCDHRGAGIQQYPAGDGLIGIRKNTIYIF